ncbi:MAG: type II secretion system protein [Leptolyngbyaceae cyanobacterium SU_3_3]|nr:type II secretion system protein [Leptolyngbyaceae cyanobacterium SU_3_3]NJR49726.1 type II secretion system protein [Leptolyngbyaceae cyanobacterium CSU_1_3]
MKRRNRSKNTIAGFTLIEGLVVLLMIAVLFAIAAPSWLALINNQRIGTARGQVFEVLRSAQDEAKRTKVSREVRFDTTSPSAPRVAILPYKPASPIPNANVNNWQAIGETRPKSVKVTTSSANGNPIIFDTYGNLDPTNSTANYKVTIQIASAQNATSGSRRCVIVKTLLGAMAEGKDAECN